MQAVLYVPSAEEFTVWWEGYTDDESGLMEHDITLMLGSDCDNFDLRQMTTVVANQALSPTSTNFTYLELNLQVRQHCCGRDDLIFMVFPWHPMDPVSFRRIFYHCVVGQYAVYIPL